jgi:hypothetical protein
MKKLRKVPGGDRQRCSGVMQEFGNDTFYNGAIDMKKTAATWALALGQLAAVMALAGCQSAYYKTMETFGYHKREILVDRVEDARDSQEEAKEQFQSALEKFSAVSLKRSTNSLRANLIEVSPRQRRYASTFGAWKT